MRLFGERGVGAGRLVALLGALLLLGACSTSSAVAVVPAPPPSDDDDFSELIAQLRSDLSRQNARVLARNPAPPPAKVTTTKDRDRQFAQRATELFSRVDRAVLQMPVVGVSPYDLANSWGNSRDGGRRKHRGIDIFAPKGTPIIAVADGILSFIGEQPKGGRCVWLTTETGRSFYYAHLDRWATGLYEGMEVRSGDLLGYVGNTGNARRTPSHLHFGINEDDKMVNPYPILNRATVVQRARAATNAGSALGTQ